MIGIIVPNSSTRLPEVFQVLAQKNYLTPLEVAALISEQVLSLTPTASEAVEALANLGVYLTRAEDAEVIAQAVKIVAYAWSDEVLHG